MKSRDLTQVALMVALIIVLGTIPGIPIGIIPVPIVLQNFGIILAGLLLGAKKGTLAIALFILLAAVGMPVLSGFRGGLAVVFGPTGGYLLGWLIMPFLLTLAIKTLHRWLQKPLNWAWLTVATSLIAIVSSYVIAAGWLSIQSQVPYLVALSANLLFIPGDIIKSAVAVMIAIKLKQPLHLKLPIK